MAQPKFNLKSGRKLGSHYEVVEYLGGGWEGEVYKVIENRTGIVRAAKIFYPKRNIDKKRLLSYARKLYKLRSCDIVMQYHHRDTSRLLGEKTEFLVSDLIEGEMLSDFLLRQKRNRLSSFQALHLLYALALGVEQIHYLGEYHGDIHSDNIMVKRRGLGFSVSLLDFYDLGRPTKERIQYDVYGLIDILYESIGGADGYRKAAKDVKQIVMGRKHTLIKRKMQNAGHLRLLLENLEWDE